jgi:glycosyltransferase involved in cell wall biosynthesis
MVSGLAVIVSNIAPFNELIEHSLSGYLVNSRSPGDLARILNMLIESPDILKRIRRSSIEMMKRKFNSRSIACEFA